jgi:hypothetical protein
MNGNTLKHGMSKWILLAFFLVLAALAVLLLRPSLT